MRQFSSAHVANAGCTPEVTCATSTLVPLYKITCNIPHVSLQNARSDGSATWHAWDRDFQFWLSESKNNRILEVNFLFTPPISIISVHSSYHPNSLRTRRPRKAPRKAKVDVLCNYILRRWQTKKKCLNAFMGHANTKLRFRDTWTCELCVAWPAAKFNGLSARNFIPSKRLVY